MRIDTAARLYLATRSEIAVRTPPTNEILFRDKIARAMHIGVVK